MTTIRPHEINPDHVGRIATVRAGENVLTGRLGEYDHDVTWVDESTYGEQRTAVGEVTTTFRVGQLTVTARRGDKTTIEIEEDQ